MGPLRSRSMSADSVDSETRASYKKAFEGYRNETKESTGPRGARTTTAAVRATDTVRCAVAAARQTRPALAAALRIGAAQRHLARAAPGPGARARAGRLLPQSLRARHRFPVPPGCRGKLLGDRAG